MKVDAPSLPRVAAQVGEVKALAEVLIAAKVNTLDAVQRERVSPDDQAGPQTDYLDSKSETNELAILTPYQFSFRCFTPELAQVLCGFASSPHGIIVKGFSVEPAPVTVVEMTPVAAAPVVYVPTPTAPQVNPSAEMSREAMFRSRYGLGPGGKGGEYRSPTPTYTPAPVMVAAPAAAPQVRTVLNEKQLKVTMLVQVVKLKS